MLSKKILIVVLVVLLLVELYLSQTTRKPKRRKPVRRKKLKPGEEPHIKCHSCYVDYTDFRTAKFNANHPCYNPKYNITQTDALYLTVCSPVTKYCTVDITRVNNVLAVIDRRCGLPTCRHVCLAKGYGVERETCTYCCPGKLTEDDPDYDPDESDNYACPNVPH